MKLPRRKESLCRAKSAIARFGIRRTITVPWIGKNNLAIRFPFGFFYIVLLADNSLISAYHEVGHVFMWQKSGRSFSKKRLDTEFKRGGYISKYASTHPHEDFAEVFARVCMKLFEGRSYTKIDDGTARKLVIAEKWIKHS